MQTCIASFKCHFFPLIKLCHVIFGNSGFTTGVRISITYTLVRHHWHAAAFDVYTTRIASIGSYLPAAETSQANHAHWFFPQLSAIWVGAFRCSAGNDLDAFQPMERHKSPCEVGLVIDGDTRQDTCPTSRSLQLAQISSKIYCSCFSFRVDTRIWLLAGEVSQDKKQTPLQTFDVAIWFRKCEAIPFFQCSRIAT